MLGGCTYCVAAVFLQRDDAGLPRCMIMVLFLHVAFTDSLMMPAAAPLARKTRSARDPGSAEATAVFTRRLLPLLQLDDSVESGDGFAASVASAVASVQGRERKSSSFPWSMSTSTFVPFHFPSFLITNVKKKKRRNSKGQSGAKFC